MTGYTGGPEDRERVTAWATDVLADPKTVILDTETTSLQGFLVEIAVIDVDRNVLFSSLINPQMPISREATQIHGISDRDVADAPGFAEVFGELDKVLEGRRVVIYNAEFDTKVLYRELQRGFVANRGCGVVEAAQRATAWMDRWATWECAMEAYSAFAGEWSEYHGSYRWLPLNGGHRALDDCLAVVTRLEVMSGRLLARGGGR